MRIIGIAAIYVVGAVGALAVSEAKKREKARAKALRTDPSLWSDEEVARLVALKKIEIERRNAEIKATRDAMVYLHETPPVRSVKS